jgi:predicted nuclease of predicted toxin-antitoxin system
MRILFDHDFPRPLRRYLTEHTIDTASEKGWAELRNGNLLDSAEREGYEIMITADQSMRYQQNIARRQVGVVVLLSNRWPDVQLRVEDIRAALGGIEPGELREVLI